LTGDERIPERVVVDASALVAVILGEAAAPTVTSILARSEARMAPSVLDLEVTSVLRRHLLQDRVTERRAVRALARLVSFPLRREETIPLLLRVLQLRDNFSTADAAYVALAELFDATLVTIDLRLARAVRRHTSVPVLP